MARSHSQRVPVRLFNQVNRLLERFGREPRPFIADDLLEAARDATKLDDFGPATYRAGLDALVQAYNTESKLNPFGRMMVGQELLGILRSRLGVIDGLKKNASALEANIERPVFVLGLPRTGTTALHDLLAQDPSAQVLDYWLAAAPGPRPPADQVASDPRFKQAGQFLRITYYLDPSLRAIHNLTPDGPDECRHLLQENFTDDTFDSNASIPSYTRWFAEQDMRPSYAHHRDTLKLIQSTCPERRWALKYPAHLRNLDVLLETYPDACIVQTHRDPAQVLPSLCSLVTNWRGIYEDEVDHHAIGQWQLEMWSGVMQRALDVRRKSNPAQFFDIHFQDMVSDPMAAISRMYGHFGFELSEEATERMTAWHHGHRQGAHGSHDYSAEQYGLTADAMAERFRPYTEYFDIR